MLSLLTCTRTLLFSEIEKIVTEDLYRISLPSQALRGLRERYTRHSGHFHGIRLNLERQALRRP
jgi:hypothetical protein